MIRNLLMVAGMLAMGTLLAPRASAVVGDVFQLNVDYCSQPCLGGAVSGGTVTVTGNNTTSVTISVALLSPLSFHQTSGLDAFMFNAVTTGGAAVTVGSLSSGFEVCGTGGGVCTANEDGAGTFTNIICLSTAAACQQDKGGPGFGGTTLSFTLTSTSAINVETLNGTSVTDFAANVTNGTCTGLIGGGNGTAASTATVMHSTGTCTAPPSVPEPTSVLLLGTGLLFAGKLLKAKLLV